MSDAAAIQRYKLTLAYRGTRYHGWQRQVPPGGEELPTVQNELRLALQRTLGHPVNVLGSSRTDAGVHARGQVAMFDTPHLRFPPQSILQSANAKLPEDIVITEIRPISQKFDAIASTIDKGYRYAINNADQRDPFTADVELFLPKYKPLDAAAMHAAAQKLVGTHDFAAFCKPGHGRETTVRTINSCDVTRQGDRVSIDVAGTGFLWNQVRIIAGTLARIGVGGRPVEWVDKLLAAMDRHVSGPTAPAHGLCLMWIRHEDD